MFAGHQLHVAAELTRADPDAFLAYVADQHIDYVFATPSFVQLLVSRPITNSWAYVLDGGLQPVGVAGELYIGGAGLASGYLHRPGPTTERFVADRFGPPGVRMYRTGDVVRRRDDGELEFIGRADDQVKVRGVHIELGEVETALLTHHAAAQAAVVAREDGGGDHRLIGYVVVAPGAAVPTTPVLRAFIGASLPKEKVPSAFVVLESLPLTANCKLDRAALPLPTDHLDFDDVYLPPRNPTEQAIAAAWAEVLGVERVGADDNFFALGDDSILAIAVVSRARAAGLALSLRLLFSHPRWPHWPT